MYDLSKLNYTVPVVASDGNIVNISNEDIPTLLFFQIRRQHGPSVEADVVAAVQFHSIEELKRLQQAIEETITRHKTREP